MLNTMDYGVILQTEIISFIPHDLLLFFPVFAIILVLLLS